MLVVRQLRPDRHEVVLLRVPQAEKEERPTSRQFDGKEGFDSDARNRL